MCGIAGLTGHGVGGARFQLVSQMVKRIAHRGPDNSNVVDRNGVCFGHARLEVIGGAGGSQPMCRDDWGVTVVFNGEIYNYIELRNELTQRGYRFHTASDTEVLLASYKEWSSECVQHFRGMFAFVIHDHHTGTLFGARDRFGKKPLVFYAAENSFAFASELKALVDLPFVPRTVDPIAISAYLEQLYVPEHRCAFQSISKLAPGHCFTWREGQLRVNEYWSPHFEVDENLNYEAALARAETTIREAVNVRLRSDVPLGVFLSGGIDSSLIALAAADSLDRPLKTFSVRMDGLPDETVHAAKVAEIIASDHALIDIPSPQTDDILEVAEIFDEPFADSSAIPMSMMSKEAKRYVTVVLSGDGGDELFGGYGSYQGLIAALNGDTASVVRLSPRLRAVRAMLPAPVEKFARGILPMLSLLPNARHALPPENILSRHCANHEIHYEPILDRLLVENMRFDIGKGRTEQRDRITAQDGGLNRVFEYDVRNYLVGDILKKVDMTTMAWGLEARAPLLDSDLARLALAMSPAMKVNKSETKRLLKDLLARRMDRSFVDRQKMGFGAPVAAWLTAPGTKALAHSLLEGVVPRMSEWINIIKARELMHRFYNGHSYLAQPLWNLLMLEIWSRKYL
ncbi:MAG: asparagine synthase (glutamine-hydrolyzing) [Pseudomonadota bacterium]